MTKETTHEAVKMKRRKSRENSFEKRECMNRAKAGTARHMERYSSLSPTPSSEPAKGGVRYLSLWSGAARHHKTEKAEVER